MKSATVCYNVLCDPFYPLFYGSKHNLEHPQWESKFALCKHIHLIYIDTIIDNLSNNIAVTTCYKFCRTHATLFIHFLPLARAPFFCGKTVLVDPLVSNHVLQGVAGPDDTFFLSLLFSLRRGSL